MVSTTGAMEDGRLSLAAINPDDGSPILNMENGRLYLAEYGNRTYMLPCDEDERRRLDLMHAFFRVARRTSLFGSHINLNIAGSRVLDIGCGTGIWSIELAPKYPHVEFVGVDIASIQPKNIARPNLRFQAPVDIEADLSYGSTTPRGSDRPNSTILGWQDAVGQAPWDLIHARTLRGAIADWPALYSRIFSSLRRGTGWLEQVDIDFTPHCDDGTLPANSFLNQWAQEVNMAFDMTPTPLRIVPGEVEILLKRTGFVDVTCEAIVVPFSGWPEQNDLMDVGRWFNVSMTEGTLASYALKPLTKFRGQSKESVMDLVGRAKTEVVARRHHAYCHLVIWKARRP